MSKAKTNTKQYTPLVLAAGMGSILGSGIIVGLSATITVWQSGLGLTTSEVGILSGALTFAIAAGAFLVGNITKRLGLIKSFNLMNLFYAIGTAICVFAPGFWPLLLGLVITGIASGADLPISLSVISHDAPDEKTRASLVSITQTFWSIGVFLSYICAFIVSTMQGALGARVVFGILTAIALFTFVWRSTSKKLAGFHEAGNRYRASERTDATKPEKELSLSDVLFHSGKKQYGQFFACIIVFYVTWNLLANTFGQFQTFTLVQANASQTFATGAGIVLNLVGLVCTLVFASVASSKHRNQFFVVGIIIQFAAMLGMSFSGSALMPIVICIACYNIGNNIAGEGLYKVWTQESYPDEARATVQGFINGFSRLCCGLFALVTPALVMPDTIRYTMLGFAGIVAISAIAGFRMMALQKKYHVGALNQNGDTQQD